MINTSNRVLLDNQFRFWISLCSFVICSLLSLSQPPTHLLIVTVLFIIYSCILGLTHLQARRAQAGVFLQYLLLTTDLLAVTAAIHLTGGFKSPLYVLYLVIYGVCLYHQSISNFVFSVSLGTLLYAALPFLSGEVNQLMVSDVAGQILLLVLLTGVFSIVLRLMKKERQLNQRLISHTLTMGKIADLLSVTPEDPQETVRTVSKLIEDEMGPEGIKCRITLHRPDQGFLPPSGGRMGVHIPIMAGDSIFGTLMVSREDQTTLSMSEQNFFSSVSRSLGQYLHRARILDALGAAISRPASSLQTKAV